MVRSLAKRFVAAFTCATLVGAAALPLASAAQEPAAPPQIIHYSTAITTAYGSPYPVAGHLDLEIFPSGTLRGYYHNAYQKAFIPVVGGRDGDYIWFDIGPTLVDPGLGIWQLGPNGKLHVVGTMGSDGGFRGQVYPLLTVADDQPYPSGQVAGAGSPTGSNLDHVNTTPIAMAAPGPGNPDQYLFAAKPVDKSDQDYPFTSPSASPTP